MSVMLWVLIALALIKLPIAALMLWLPFRSDQVMYPGEDPDGDSNEPGDGGEPTDGRPRSPRPRRGAHGPPPPAPARIRKPATGAPRRTPARSAVSTSRARSSRAGALARL